jgi:hypothetical protein
MSRKLIRQLIRETLVLESNQPTLLYHATCYPPESFTKGIDPSKAQGFGQGKGFYVFRDKQKAIKHAQSLESDAIEKQIPCPPGPDGKIKAYIIAIDEPINPESYDIDYEVYSRLYVDFLVDNQQSISPQLAKEIGVAKFLPNGVSIFRRDGDSDTFRTARKTTLDSRSDPDPSTDTGTGADLSLSARRLAQHAPQLFKQFEDSFLPKAGAIKYNGDKSIVPHHIEDTQGNIVWSR